MAPPAANVKIAQVLANRLEAAMDSNASSIIFYRNEFDALHSYIRDSQRLKFIVDNWDMDLDEVRVLTDMAVEALPLKSK